MNMSTKETMDHISTETLVIGGGVIGLAVARQLAQSDRQVILVEKEAHLGEHSSSRNSEVIHGGLYYPRDSLKTEFCIQGRPLLYSYLEQRNLPYKKCQKVIVSPHSDQEQQLHLLYKTARDNGVSSLSLLSQTQLKLQEPNIRGTLGILSKETGIFDSHHYLKALRREFLQAQGIIALNSPVLHIHPSSSSTYPLKTQVWGRSPCWIQSREVINCAGLWAPVLLQKMVQDGYIHPLPSSQFDPMWVKGNYLRLNGPSPSQRLIYPLPQPGGLGIHLTLNLQGQARFGPDVEEINFSPFQTLKTRKIKPQLENKETHNPLMHTLMEADVDYTVYFNRKKEAFLKDLKPIFPHLHSHQLQPDYAGIRIKNKPLGQFSDFLFLTSKTHGYTGLIHACGIESPGLTASLAIARYIVDILDKEG